MFKYLKYILNYLLNNNNDNAPLVRLTEEQFNALNEAITNMTEPIEYRHTVNMANSYPTTAANIFTEALNNVDNLDCSSMIEVSEKLLNPVKHAIERVILGYRKAET